MRIKIYFILTVLGAHILFGQNDYLVTMSTIKSRPLALGGAFVAMQNEWAALYYNPAGFHVSRTDPDKTFAVTFNPLGPIFVISERDKYSKGSVSAGWIINAIGIKTGMLSWGLLMGEESLANSDRLNRSQFFDAVGYETNRNAAIGLSIALAPRVRFGMAGDMFIRKGGLSKVKFGYRYGLMVKPRENLEVGLCYVDFPKENADDRMELERLADETLNIGVAYSPYKMITLYIDVRNVSGEGKSALLEPHFGLEMDLMSHYSLRGGYYRTRGGEEKSWSFGIGAQDMLNGLFWESSRSPVRMDFDVTCIWQQERSVQNRWFFMALRLIL
ncbi:hypothetical protein HQ585_02880 [candidate division KSB1 bacterium]|nr:hypothetical protein [candidate division KSB1 bacterium]